MDRNTGRHGEGGVGNASLNLSGLRIEHLWMLVPAFVVTWMGFMHPLRLLDFWWHLKVGEIIVTSGQIPRVDLFSFTYAGQPFIHHDWLGEVLYYVVYRVGGFPLVIAGNTALLLLAFLLIFHLCRQATNRARIAALCSLVPAVALGVNSNARTQVYSFVLFAAFYWFLWTFRQGRRDILWGLPLLMALWVNLHGAFVLGIGLMGLFLGAETVRCLLYGADGETLEPSALAKLALVLMVTLLACLANPEGLGVFAYVRQLQVAPSVQQFVTEWQVPSVQEAGDVLAFFGPFLLALLVLFYSPRWINLTELMLFLTFAVLGLRARRHGIWFALIIAPIAARHLTEIDIPNALAKMRGQALPRRSELDVGRGLRGSPHLFRINSMILACLVLFTVLLSPWIRPRLSIERLRPGLLDEATPVGAMDYIETHPLQGNIFHPQNYGDYLIWRLWPQQRSFFDGRVHLFDDAFVGEYILTMNDRSWETRLAQYDIRYLLLPKDTASFSHMIQSARESKGWALLYEDELSVLFAKRS